MKINYFILIILIIAFFSSEVLSDYGSFNVTDDNGTQNGTSGYPYICGGGSGAVLLEYFPVYEELNTYSPIQVWYTDSDGELINQSNTSVMLYLNDTYYNFTYNDAGYWLIYLSSDEEQDINFNIIANSNTYECINDSYMIRFRDPFYATFYFFKKNLNGSLVPYEGDFHYVYLQFENYTSWNPIIDLTYLDYAFRWLPYYEDSFTKVTDVTTSFWARYDDDNARIKLYDPGNYTLNVMAYNILGEDWDYEFYKPQFDRQKYDNEIDFKIEITNTSSSANIYYVYISQWELAKESFFFDIIKNLVVIALYILLLWGVFYVFPSDLGVKVAGALALITLPLLLKILGVF